MKPGGLALSELNVRHIVVDGDACPVKAEIAETALRFKVPVLLVSSFDHFLQGGEGVRTVQVDRSDQSADLYIANHIKPYDVVITQDYGLAALALGKRCYVLSFRGREFNDRDIDFMLDSRHTAAKARKRGHYGKGPKPFTEQDREIFQHKLTKLLKDLQENV
ncbi:YaiI/YqxD family protein [Paenibacillus sp. OK003]|uniref:YaiI/YqxD family protein n=1 Tax=Paenibacillus sp. OK003 TaxID=1884380 RepID=UPI00158704E9|nr:YaiI/YqxD family protein [Paenibacillus sp. OK003]